MSTLRLLPVLALLACSPPGSGTGDGGAADAGVGSDGGGEGDAAPPTDCEKTFRLDGHAGATSVLLTGSFTTVMAFSALHFANSTVLQDFGLFSSLALFGAALFTLTALPVVLSSTSFDIQKIPGEHSSFRIPTIPDKWRGATLAGIAVLTVIFLYFSGGT